MIICLQFIIQSFHQFYDMPTFNFTENFVLIFLAQSQFPPKFRHGDSLGEYAEALINYAGLCEPATDDEENAFNIIITEDMTIDDVMQKVLDIVQKLNGN